MTPGSRAILCVEVEVLTTSTTPWGPEVKVALPRPLRMDDLCPLDHVHVLEDWRDRAEEGA